eukprot:2689983-Amphidinium_carterae.1
MRLPEEFLNGVPLEPSDFLDGGGHAPLCLARRLTGKCARIAQVVPFAMPFASALWAALAAALQH